MQSKVTIKLRSDAVDNYNNNNNTSTFVFKKKYRKKMF